MIGYNESQDKGSMRDFRLSPRSRWELRSSGLLCNE